MRKGNTLVAALGAALLAAGCGGGGHASSGGSALGAATAANGSAAAPTSVAPPAPGLDALPLVIVHGIGGAPADFDQLCDKLGPGRTVYREIYIDEADALPTASVPADSIFVFGYYRSHVGGPDFDPHGSIGGCPVARSDWLDASTYTTSYADRLRRCVENVKRATGSKKVDLALHSMGGLVGRAYAHWLSLDATGASSVRRIFLIASPGRGINALECVALAVAKTGSVEFMRQGECLELCGESHTWGGESYVARLNDDWDGFCARERIRYAGLSATGMRGAPGGSTGSVIPGGGLPIGPIQQFLTGLQQTGSLNAVWPLVGQALADLPSQVAVALGPSDGTVRVESSRLDAAPFLGSAFWGIVEAKHSGRTNSEQMAQACTYTAECIRTFCIEARDPGTAKCDALSVKAIDAPGHATWIQVDVTLSGTNVESSPLALQLVESTLDANGAVTANVGYGAALRKGSQRFAFAVPPGPGTRHYRAVVYGEHGPLGVAEETFSLAAGALDDAPVAGIQASARGAAARLDLASNGAAEFSVRFDRGAWSDWSSAAVFDTPPLLVGVHRVEVRARSAANGAGVVVEGTAPAAVGVVVDAAGGMRFVR